MRENEGEMIAFDITDRINRIEQNVHQIEINSGDLLFHYQERLRGRIGILTRGMVDIDPERIAQEAAFLADKSDISEEILKVKSHIKQFYEIMKSEDLLAESSIFYCRNFTVNSIPWDLKLKVPKHLISSWK